MAQSKKKSVQNSGHGTKVYNAATKNKRLGTTGTDPQRKRTSSNKTEGVEIKRKDLLKEADNAATKKIRDLERQGKTHNENARVQTKMKERQLGGRTH